MDWADLEHQIKDEVRNLGGAYVWTDVILQGSYHIQRNVNTGRYRLLDGDSRRLLLSSYDGCKEKLDQLDPAFENDHLVLLIHGLGRHAGIMDKTKDALRKAGYAAHSLNYATLFEGVADHAIHFTHLLENLKGIKKLSFVTHSLGGLVARELLRQSLVWNGVTAHKLVMMGTPNKGAQIAAFLGRLKAYHFISGPSGKDVMPDKIVKELPEPPIPTLIMAGGLGNDIGFNPLLPGDNDGIVRVEETRLDAPHEFKLVKVIHTTIMDHKDSIKATLDFIGD